MPRSSSSSSSGSNSTNSSGSGSGTTSSSSSSSDNGRQKKRKKKPAKPASPVSTSVSQPRNKSKLKKKKPGPKNKQKGNVLPLLLENVTEHTEKVKHAVNKGNTVEAFLNTLDDSGCQYSVDGEPDIVPIPTPQPEDKAKKPSKKLRKPREQKQEEEPDDEADNRPIRKEPDERRVPQTDSSKDAGLTYDALQEKFAVLAGIGVKDKSESGRAYDEEFKRWCEENRERFSSRLDENQGDPQNHAPTKQKSKPAALGNLTRAGKEAIAVSQRTVSDPSRLFSADSGFVSAGVSLPNSKNSTAHTASNIIQPRPSKVSKSTSGMQTEEHEAMPARFTIPEVLMLDSYTQTNEEDRLSTTPIRCKKQTSDAQTEPIRKDTKAAAVPAEPTPITSKRVNFDVQFVSERQKTFNRSVEAAEEAPPPSFELKRHCRHGNERKTCVECNNSIVHRKYRVTPVEEPAETISSRSNSAAPKDLDLSEREGNSKYISVIEQDDNSSRAIGFPDPPVVSRAKLARIKHLARAKLKQIKEDDEPDMPAQTERYPDVVVSDDERQSHQPRRRRIHNGVESFSLQDLPPLVGTPRAGDRTGSPIDSDSDEEDKSSHRDTIRRVHRLREDKRLADVTRAKQFIKHCIETPITRDSGDTEVYTHRRRRDKDGRPGSLPQLNQARRCGSEAKRRSRGIADDVESRRCVSEVQAGKLRKFDVNYKAYINALERIVDSNLSSLVHTDNYYKK